MRFYFEIIGMFHIILCNVKNLFLNDLKKVEGLRIHKFIKIVLRKILNVLISFLRNSFFVVTQKFVIDDNKLCSCKY